MRGIFHSAHQDVRWWLAATLLALILGAAFQGGRGVWDPSEGFYTNTAVTMVHSGDWWTPRLNGEPFLDKPPMVYWSIAAGIKLLGVNEWGSRLTLIFWYAGTALLVGALAHSLWGGRYGPLATVFYALTFLPFVAANVVTTDTILAFWTTATVYAFWRMDSAGTARGRSLWAVSLGAAIGLGLLTKGPAMLVFLPPLAAFLLLRGRLSSALRVPGLWAGVALALALGGSWYFSMAASLPGAFDYFLDNQVIGRVVSTKYGRNPGLVGLFSVYVPTLILGALPFSIRWPQWIARSAQDWRRSSWWRRLPERPAALLIVLWFALPLGVLLAASSRLPLYALPLAAPLALVSARMLGPAPGHSLLRRGSLVSLVLWVGFLLAVKFSGALWPTAHDARATARALEAQRVPPSAQVVAVNRLKNSLAVYGYGNIRQAATGGHEIYFSPIPSLEETVESLAPVTPSLFIGNEKDLGRARLLLGVESTDCRLLAGGHREESFLWCAGR